MLDLYRWRLVEATELDGEVIDDPKCLSYQGLLDFIKKHEYPINPLLYPTDQELRDAILLYEDDDKGQQKLQARWEQINGPVLKVAQEIDEIDDVFEELAPVSQPLPVYTEPKHPIGEKEQLEHRRPNLRKETVDLQHQLDAKRGLNKVTRGNGVKPGKEATAKSVDDFFAEPEEASVSESISDELAPGVEMKELDASALK